MMRSMYSGVSGLRTHQTKMDVIANNISNVNTVGFKSSRVTFTDVFSQTVSGASKANEATGRGGTNAMQIGLGVNLASIDKDMGTGAAQRTDNALDLMINGDGFFIVNDSSGTYFTRAGAFELDSMGYLVNSNGMRVCGWDTGVDKDGNIKIQRERAEPIQIAGDKEYSPPTTTKNVVVTGNLNALAVAENISPPRTHTASISYYDSLGNRWVVDATFTYPQPTTPITDKTSKWTVTIGTDAYPNGDRTLAPVKIETNPAAAGTFEITFDENGRMKSVATPAADNPFVKELTFNPANIVPPASLGEGAGVIRFDFTNLTQFGNETTSAKYQTKDGNPPGTLEGLSVGSDGIITGRYSNGNTKTLGQIPITKFKNPAGLEAVGSNLFVTTANSGDFDPMGEETSNIMGGVLEMSNVDLAAEFTEMITTQRGFQASSRLITTSDEMITELVNLKR